MAISKACSIVAFAPLLLLNLLVAPTAAVKVAIIGSGVAGSSAAYFLNKEDPTHEVHVFEQHEYVGGRVKDVYLAGDRFEAGATIVHRLNKHMMGFAKMLNLTEAEPVYVGPSLGIWNGHEFVLRLDSVVGSGAWWARFLDSWVTRMRMLWRYGLSPIWEQQYVTAMLANFTTIYDKIAVTPYASMEALLSDMGLYAPTQRQLAEELLAHGVDPLFINEICVAISRINYGQNTTISGLAGGVSMAGGDGNTVGFAQGLQRIPEGLLALSGATVHLNTTVLSVTTTPKGYKLETTNPQAPNLFDAVLVATPLENAPNLHFNPAVKVPPRKMQTTHATFLRGNLNPAFFGQPSGTDLPKLIATTESPAVNFSSIGVIRAYPDRGDFAFKVFSREKLDDAALDQIFRQRNETVRVEWSAYPHYSAPEIFAPIKFDEKGLLYYINSYENAASATECAALFAENVVRLLLHDLSARKVNACGWRGEEQAFDVTDSGQKTCVS
ncbi:hypothetical protein KFL_003170040 [Klebsormidium nitens]|uniref:Prenylcysteine lyase domain-containing protein n=1 Tax=Klebsormidium nitens TaxID=105231 RepID=A0A1Y1IDT9_KLENI|nr:hypothetical protein KFL_003170040 [Klebsormidium nitens]|eukprot:GAQ86866.1 hypothetical protein KFL_003170040 [Klebsormidium nitens]